MSNKVNQPTEVLHFLREFAMNPRGFLLLSGENGTGKSFAARSVYNCISPYKLPEYDHDKAIFISQADLNLIFNDLEGKGVSLLAEKYSSTKLLVLDDLGTRKPSDAFMDFLYAIADKRYSERETRGTIITTNLTHKDLIHKFGSAFASRVATGKCFRFEGEDRRDNGVLFAFLPLLIDYLEMFGSIDVF